MPTKDKIKLREKTNRHYARHSEHIQEYRKLRIQRIKALFEAAGRKSEENSLKISDMFYSDLMHTMRKNEGHDEYLEAYCDMVIDEEVGQYVVDFH